MHTEQFEHEIETRDRWNPNYSRKPELYLERFSQQYVQSGTGQQDQGPGSRHASAKMHFHYQGPKIYTSRSRDPMLLLCSVQSRRHRPQIYEETTHLPLPHDVSVHVELKGVEVRISSPISYHDDGFFFSRNYVRPPVIRPSPVLPNKVCIVQLLYGIDTSYRTAVSSIGGANLRRNHLLAHRCTNLLNDTGYIRPDPLHIFDW